MRNTRFSQGSAGRSAACGPEVVRPTEAAVDAVTTSPHRLPSSGARAAPIRSKPAAKLPMLAVCVGSDLHARLSGFSGDQSAILSRSASAPAAVTSPPAP